MFLIGEGWAGALERSIISKLFTNWSVKPVLLPTGGPVTVFLGKGKITQCDSYLLRNTQSV